MTRRKKLRLAGALLGDIYQDPGAKTKYGFLFQALAEPFSLVEVYDASLQGAHRYLNVILTFHWDMRRWRESFYKNVNAFRLRSELAADHFQARQDEIDVILQVGVLFNAAWQSRTPPSIIYTDYTAQLASQFPEAGRSPFSAEQRATWLSLEQEAYAQARHICTRSDLVRRSIIHDYGISPERITVIGGGINFFCLPETCRHQETESPTILFIGKELYRKGGDLLLRAFARVRQEVPEAQLLMLTDDKIPASLSSEGVTVIEPTWDRERIAQLYRAADLFVLPSRLETWGDVLLEAMSYGLPCVGVAGQSMEEIIADEETGFIVVPENVDALAQALLRLCHSAALRQQMGQAGRIRAEKYFTWQIVAARIKRCVEWVLLQHE